MKLRIKKVLFYLFDWVLLPFSIIYLPLLKRIRKKGIVNFPMHDWAFKKLGVFPIQDHYYEPRFVFDKYEETKQRNVHIHLNVQQQLAMLAQYKYIDELSLPLNNPNFSQGDADLYYLIIRNTKPKRIIEIGSGFSTLIAVEAIKKNSEEGVITQLTCIEPFEFTWLEDINGIEVIRKKVEEMPLDFFGTLESGDILFIDSSHMIRTGNDVLFEYLYLLPVLKKGVLIHIHDIFTPNDYPQQWVKAEKRFWNEQYLLEAFLYYNDTFTVKFALNYLKHSHFNELKEVCKSISSTCEPGSFWLEKMD